MFYPRGSNRGERNVWPGSSSNPGATFEIQILQRNWESNEAHLPGLLVLPHTENKTHYRIPFVWTLHGSAQFVHIHSRAENSPVKFFLKIYKTSSI